MLSTSRISSVAYALDDSGSLQKTGRASRLGSVVSSMRLELIGRPRTILLGRLASTMSSNPFRADGPRVLTEP